MIVKSEYQYTTLCNPPLYFIAAFSFNFKSIVMLFQKMLCVCQLLFCVREAGTDLFNFYVDRDGKVVLID